MMKGFEGSRFQARKGPQMLKNFKELIAHGSNCELETQILLCGDLGFV
jgi:hypothetical protein